MNGLISETTSCNKCGFSFVVVTLGPAVSYCPYCGKILREVKDEEYEEYEVHMTKEIYD